MTFNAASISRGRHVFAGWVSGESLTPPVHRARGQFMRQCPGGIGLLGYDR